MSTLTGKIGRTAKDNDDSSGSENSSDAEYELQEIRPQVYGSRSSLSRRERKKCCTYACVADWTIIVIVFLIFYVLCGLFTWALIMAMLDNTFDTLVAFGVIWVVFVIVLFTLIIIISTKKLKEREAHARAIQEEELRRREGIKANLEKND